MNKQTEQMIEFIDLRLKEEVMDELENVPQQATISGADKLKKYMYGELVNDVKDCYPIIHDFMTHCMGLVEWEKVAAIYLDQKGE